MSRNSDDERNVSATEIWNDLLDLRDAFRRYQHALSQAGIRNVPPDQSSRVIEERVTLHMALSGAFTLIRPYIEDEDEYWAEWDLDPDRDISGLQILDDALLSAHVQRWNEQGRHGRTIEHVDVNIPFLSNKAYQNAVNGLFHAAVALGFAPEGKPLEDREAVGRYSDIEDISIE